MFNSDYFNKYYINDFITQQKKQLKYLVDNLNDEYFDSCDDKQLTQYLKDKIDFDYIKVHDLESPQIDMIQKTEQEQRVNPFPMSFEPKTYNVEVDNIYWYVSVRLTGDITLLKVQPSRCVFIVGRNYENIKISTPRDNDYHLLTVTIKKALSDAKQYSDNISLSTGQKS